ncbi:MAG: glutamate-5-semialdehyde dehydrogenase [Candidatus Marinimicrobia bacterium]|nr:glutamate-5-semialdehyde dehydrogenase [Candidatus Neomarinimicrobiota bacterium]
MNMRAYVEQLGERALQAAASLATLSSEIKNNALGILAGLLESRGSEVLAANKLDIASGREAGLAAAMIDRLTVDQGRLDGLAQAVREVAALPDPVGRISSLTRRPNGLLVGRMRIPLGVVAFIFESRPNVTIDGAVLCLKSGNAVILRGGKEALNTNLALAALIDEALSTAGCPAYSVQVVNITDRSVVEHLLKLDRYVNLLIPRGGEGLIRYVAENARVPVLKHYKGVCHVYIDKDAHIGQGLEIALNSKVQRPGVCNAAETLLVHEAVAERFLPEFIDRSKEAGLELRGCSRTRQLAPDYVKEATEDDWDAEYLALILAVKVVESYEEAVEHIRRHGSDHTEAIITENYTTGLRFINEVQSSLVLINASTRFNDGGELGMGAEIGISTTKLHAFGPMGLEHLTIEKHIAFGNGQIRE